MTVRIFVWLGLAGALGLLLVWAVYPLIVRLLALLRRGHSPSSRDAPMVSVVLATREDAPAIRVRVQDLLHAEYEREKLEVIVALDASNATTAESLVGLPANVRVVRGDDPGGKSSTLNAGVRAARGDVLVFADSWQRFHPRAIGVLARRAMVGRTGAVSGRLVLPDSGSFSPAHAYLSYESTLRQAEARVHSAVGVVGAIWGMRRQLWKPLPPALILDDVYTPMRLVLDGWRIDYAREATAHETRAPEAGSEFRRKVRTLTGVIQLCAWLPAVLLPIRNPIWAQFVSHKLLRLLTPYFLLLIAVAAVGMLVATLGARTVAGGVGVALAVAALLAASSGIRARMRSALMWGVGIQAAVVVAALNGLRGRWDVWSR